MVVNMQKHSKYTDSKSDLFNLHIYPVLFKNETRILKEVEAISDIIDKEDKIIIISINNSKKTILDKINDQILIEIHVICQS